MLENFFQLGPIPANHMVGWYDIKLVMLSFLVATFASYIALDITGRLRDVNNTSLSIVLWVCGGALAMGAGIWSMHFIGMLAFNLPMQMMYSAGWTSLSMLVAIGASGFALYLLRPTAINLPHIILGGVILGFAIAAMHYTGMQAMTINMNIRYLPGLFALSIVIAVIASEAALWLALKSTEVTESMKIRLKIVSAFIMGAAICGMHYTGMSAAVFTPETEMMHMESGLNPQLMAISIATVTFIILGIAFVVSTYRESINQQQLLTARQAGMAEVAASVLHNVGNVLNSINVSSHMLAETVNKSKLIGLSQLNELIQEKSNNLIDFFQNDPRSEHFPKFLNSLTEYWNSERDVLSNEIKVLQKNIEHVKNVIASQQDLSRISESRQMLSINNLIEEAILLSGVSNQKHEIHITKEIEFLKPVLVDKVKILQILVNLIQNAKDAIIEADQADKIIRFRITCDDNTVFIAISDNGVGIAQEDLIKVFRYGFTTKKTGHGFGLHTSAILAKDMRGNLRAASQGKNQGATFTLELPYQTHL